MKLSSEIMALISKDIEKEVDRQIKDYSIHVTIDGQEVDIDRLTIEGGEIDIDIDTPLYFPDLKKIGKILITDI